ncbi:MAG: stalk domain-containing protein, partial [Fervidobacterium sp.]
KEIYIKYNVEVSFADIKPCPTYNCTISGKVTIGNNQPPAFSLVYSVAYPDKKLATYQTSSGQFSLNFPGTSILGISYLYISDGYPAVSPDNDAIIYGFIPNYSTITWTLKEIVPGAPLYNDEEGNLSQSIVFYLEDSDGKPVSGKADKFYVSMSWTAPHIKEIAEGVYKIYGGTIKGNTLNIYVKDVINSNTITKNLVKLTYFNPYIEVDAKYSAPPYGSGPYTDNTLGKTVFDMLPISVGNSLEIRAGVYDILDIKDPANTQFTLKDNYYIYKTLVTFSSNLEKHSVSVNDTDVFYAKSSTDASVKVEAIVWQRANQNATPSWKLVSPDPYNACCVKNLSQTFVITGSTSPCDFAVSPSVLTVNKVQDLSVGVKDSFSIVHLYMVNEIGAKLQDAITVSYKQGRERKIFTDLWYNPLHIAGTNIPELPVSFSFDDNVDVSFAAGKVIFKGISFNYITNYPLSKNKVVVEIFGKYKDTYPYCGIFDGKIQVTPEITTLSGDFDVVSASGISKTLTAMVKQSIIVRAPFTYKDVFFNVLLNNKALAQYKINYSYGKQEEGTYKINFDRPLPYDEIYSPNKLSITIEAFSDDLMREEELSINITVIKITKESNPPEITLKNPQDNALVNTKSITVSGTVTDDTSVNEFLINGEPFVLSETGNFEKDITLTEGENTITFKATDIFMNEKTLSIKVFCDTVPPAFAFEGPSETTQSKITIKGTTEKDAKIFFRDTQLENRNGSFQIEVDLLEGKNYFFFSFEDPAGNKSKTTIAIERKIVTTIVLEIGSPVMYVNSSLAEIDPGRATVPVIKNGRTLLPVRAIIESLGGYVSWDGNERKVFINLGTIKIELWIGKNVARVNGTDKLIDPENPEVVPLIINDRTMLPIRFIAENLGATVDWDAEKKIVKITYIH